MGEQLAIVPSHLGKETCTPGFCSAGAARFPATGPGPGWSYQTLGRRLPRQPAASRGLFPEAGAEGLSHGPIMRLVTLGVPTARAALTNTRGPDQCATLEGDRLRSVINPPKAVWPNDNARS